MKTIMKNFTVVLMMLLVSTVLNAQQQPGDCIDKNQTFRNAKNVWIVGTVNKPLDNGQINRFKGLDYYDIDCSKRARGAFDLDASEKDVKKVDGEYVKLVISGTVSFQYEGQAYKMTVYQDKYHKMQEFENAGTYFIAFKDASNNDSPDAEDGTWKDGRYLIIDKPDSNNQVSLDFNRAVNSWDAYRGDGFSTLEITGGNIMAAPLTVGERKYEDRTR